MISDAQLDAVRVALARMDQAVATHQPSPEVREAYAALSQALALEALPPRRQCPVCKHLGMRDARRCGFCWTALTPQ